MIKVISIWVVIGLSLLAGPVFARVVNVTSGEHDGFTRVVLNFGKMIDWQFGSIIDGYRFRPIAVTADYDLAPVFDKIGKSRLAAISENSETSELDIGFACACHAIAFEFRPGIIVIDLRDGPPPSGSSFENPLPEFPSVPSAKPGQMEPSSQQQSVYNWTDRLLGSNKTAATDAAQDAQTLAPLPSSLPNLQPLRDQLLRQLSRGASEGVIELALPPTPAPIPPKAEIDAARVALGELGSISVQTARSADLPMGATGVVCISADKLAFTDWADGWDGSSALTEVLAQDMNSLVGEFDMPNPDSVARAVKARLFMGFGLEARQILASFPIKDEDQEIWTGLSRLLDGELDPASAFLGQAQCDTPAALWAVLADTSLTSATQINANAVILAFSRLPAHLRKLVGPQLIERFLAMKEDAAASTLRDAILRASGEMPADLPIAEARIALAKGDPVAAEAFLENAVSGASISSAKALIALVDARISQDLPVDRQTVGSLSALQSEMRDTEIAPDISSALIRAEAASGNFDSAFSKLVDMPAQTPTVWRALAKLGDDSTLLQFSVPAPDPFPTDLDAVTINEMGARLLNLGLPQPALDWFKKSSQPDKVLTARAYVALRDPQSALLAVDQLTTPDALMVRAQAQRLLGNPTAAAATLAIAEQADSRASALAQARDWVGLAQDANSNWAALAAELNKNLSNLPSEMGPLAAGKALAQQSAGTRAEIDKLLSGFSPPQTAQ